MKCSPMNRTNSFPPVLLNRRAMSVLATLALSGLAATGVKAGGELYAPIADNGASAPTLTNVAASQLDYGGGTYNLNNSQDFTDNAGDPGQTFTSSVNGILSALTMKGGSNGYLDPNNDYIQMQVSSVNTATGALTSLGTFYAPSSQVTSNSDFFTFNNLQIANIHLTAGSTYAYDVWTTGNYFGLARSNGDTYAGGTAFNSNQASRTYATSYTPPGNGYDRTFEVGTEIGTTITDNGTTAPAGSLVSQSDFSGTPNGSQDYTNNNGPGQTFTPTTTFSLNSLTIKGNGGAGNGFQNGNFNLSISSVGSDGTTLTELARFAAPAAPLNPGGSNSINNNDYFTFNNLSQAGLTLTAGQKYAFAVSSDAGYFGLAEANGDVLPNGAAYTSTNFAFDGESANTYGYDRTFFIGGSITAAPEPSQIAGLGFAAFGALGLILKARRRKIGQATA